MDINLVKLKPAAKRRIHILRANMLAEPQVCTEKAKYMTESFRETEGAPAAERRARALESILSKLTIGIGEGELFVGRPTGKVRGGPLSPEVNASWYVQEMDNFHTREEENYAPLSAQERETVRDACDYWQGKSLYDHWQAQVPEQVRIYNGTVISGGGFCLNTQYFGHISTDFGRILEKGVSGLWAEIDERIAAIGSSDDEKVQYLRAMRRSLGAVVILAQRYAALAQEMARKEPDSQRRCELEHIAATCRRVPEYPARTLYEAIQSTWFTFIALNNEAWGAGPSLSRADQYLYPYYLADRRTGRLTDEQALEYLASFLIKQNGQFTVYSTPAAKIFGGLSCRLGTTIGGLRPNGESAVNELSYLFLKAARYGLTEDLMVLTGENTPEDFLVLALETARALRGKLKFIGQDVLVQQLVHDGYPREVANGCAVTGCNSPSVPGQSLDLPGGMINLPLILDLALHDGYSPRLKRQLGPHTGDARSFETYEQLVVAFQRQFSYVLPYMHLYKNVDKQVFAQYAPCPFQSAMMQRCVERAEDIARGALYPYMSYSMSVSGAPNVGDALYAVKRLVFDEGQYTMAQMMDALDNDYAGHEMLLNQIQRLPKFGNDDARVDQIVEEVLRYVSGEIAKTPGFADARSTCAAATITANIPMGADVGALPDGRRAGEPIAEGGISPHQGRNVSGITATMASVAKLDPLLCRHGSVLNLRIDPKAVDTPEKLKKLAALVRTFHAMGGYLVQFNIVSSVTLRDAQQHPEQYQDLLVRVSTYSAYFVELSETLQNDIIARMEVGAV